MKEEKVDFLTKWVVRKIEIRDLQKLESSEDCEKISKSRSLGKKDQKNTPSRFLKKVVFSPPRFLKKLFFQKVVFFVTPFKMWVLKVRSTEKVVGEFKSQAALAKYLGLSQQYVNRKIRKDGEGVVFGKEKEFVCHSKKTPPPAGAAKPQPAKPKPKPQPVVPQQPEPLSESEEETDEEETGLTELLEMKTWEILERKYPDFWCKATIGKSDQTIMLLFHALTGKYAKVRNYRDIEEFFQREGYSSYLTEKLFEEKKRRGEVFFQACRGKKKESWFRLILCKTDHKMPTVEEMQKEMKAAKQEAKAWKHRLASGYLKEALSLPRSPPKPLRPPPEEVVEIQKAGQKTKFENSSPISLDLFDSAKNVAAYIRSGLRQRIFWVGAKTRQTVLIDNREVYLPDLVKEIIVFHIRGKMWEEGNAEGMRQWVLQKTENLDKKNNAVKQLSFMRKTRNLEPMEIFDITKKLAGFI